MDNLIFLDTETTGITEPRACQIAFYAPVKDGSPAIECSLFKPPKPIETGAMATHHITNEMVEGANPFEGSLFKTLLIDHLNSRILVAHNAKFDIGVLKNEGVETKWFIDTLRVARHILPNRESHALQFLRYDLKIDPKQFFDFEINAHAADGDVAILVGIFDHLRKVLAHYHKKETYKDQIIEMVRLTKEPVTLDTIGFGKYRGSKFADVAKMDPGYLKWMLNAECEKPAEEQGEDLLHTLFKYVK